MKKFVMIFLILFTAVLNLSGCASYDPKDKQALRTLAGGAAGALISWNTGGAIVGAFVADIVNITTVKYEDKQLEDREEASRRLNDKYKAEKARPGDKKAERKKEDKQAEQSKSGDKKAEQKKEDKQAEQIKSGDKKAEQKKEADKQAERVKDADKKAEEKKELDKQAEQSKSGDKKAEQKKEVDKQAERIKDADKKAEDKRETDKQAEQIRPGDKKAEQMKDGEKQAERERLRDREKRVELFIERSSVATHNIHVGSTVEADVQYILLAPPGSEEVKITETRILWAADKKMELAKREITKTSGTHVSMIKFTMPEEMPRGYCILYTTISAGSQTKTAKSVINII